MRPFNGVDYMKFDSLLAEDEIMVRDTVRRFVEEQVKPIIEQCHREARFPRELIGPMAELELLGPNLPVEEEPVLSQTAYGLMMQELERGDSGIRSLPRCRGHWSCIPSTPSVLMNSGGNGCPRCGGVKKSAVSV